MNGGTRIVAIEPGQPDNGMADDVLELADTAPGEEWSPVEDEAEDIPANRSSDWIVPTITGLTIVGWTAFYGWANRAVLSQGGTPAEWSGWIIAWSAPTLLILVGCLLLQRTSRREGARFADVALSMNRESALLEERLRALNAELSLARDFIAAQSRDLEALGRIAVERISGSAHQLAGLVTDNGKRIDSIQSVSSNALENMEKLRGQLPVIANAAKDVTNNIASAGRTAQIQLRDMAQGFQRLNEFGIASDRHVQNVRDGVASAIEELSRQADQLGEIARTRFAALASEGEIHRQRLDQDEIAALAAIRARAAALSEELAAHRAAAEATEGVAIDSLRARLAALRDESARVSGEIAGGEATALTAWSERAAQHAAFLREALTALTRDHHDAVEAGSAQVQRFASDARDLSAALRAELDALQGTMAARRAEADTESAARAEALAARLAEVDAALAARRAAAEAASSTAAQAFTARLAELDRLAAAQVERQSAQAGEFAAHCAAIEARVREFSEVIGAANGTGQDLAQTVTASLATLNERLAASREALAGTDRQVADLTDASVRLLELIQASSDHAGSHIPKALGTAEGGLKGIEDRIFTLRDTLASAGDNGRDLSEYVLKVRGDAAGAMEDLAALQDAMGERAASHESAIAALRDELARVRAETEALAGQVDGALRASIARLEDSARGAVADIEKDAAARISAVAAALGEQTETALARVIETRATELVASIEGAVGRAAETSRDTALQLRDQLAKVDELAGNLESRVTQARARAEEQVDSDFARRVALITESLNSTAIDLAKVLSTEVTDTAWAAYMRGDRGIFTRRAVTLLDGAEAKAVLVHYERDGEFREHVNHYIHDFEAMLRQLLSTRDGNALGVTLLSSDMGKLYVALAQAIERLRT